MHCPVVLTILIRITTRKCCPLSAHPIDSGAAPSVPVPDPAAIPPVPPESTEIPPAETPPVEMPVEMPPADPNLFFDDFNYASNSDVEFTNFGWTLKSGAGFPGLTGAVWNPENVSFVADPEIPNNQLMRMTSSTETRANISQSEACHQFKFLEGTYAARVRFTDTAESGTTADQVIQTFFTISAEETRDMALPQYSECDFEYLPNGAWGAGQRLELVTWESYDYTNGLDIRNNAFSQELGSQQGWHTLHILIMNGSVVYSLDGSVVGTHGGEEYPRIAHGYLLQSLVYQGPLRLPPKAGWKMSIGYSTLKTKIYRSLMWNKESRTGEQSSSCAPIRFSDLSKTGSDFE